MLRTGLVFLVNAICSKSRRSKAYALGVSDCGRIRLSERRAMARTQESKASERRHVEYLTRLDDPMDPIHLM